MSLLVGITHAFEWRERKGQMLILEPDALTTKELAEMAQASDSQQRAMNEHRWESGEGEAPAWSKGQSSGLRCSYGTCAW